AAFGAVIIGLIAGVLVVFCILALDKLKIDDPVGAISVHGGAGFYGLMVVPFTAEGTSFLGQLIGALVIFGWVFVVSFAVWFAIKWVMGIRVSEEEEFEGLDLAECGMEAYPEFTNK
ncbi:MAG TPA: ammonium transporter, partial [Cellvibrio sp.]|nr:ammonium transporter [Cellvibrio sp.]